jgi:uncharacterized protein (DUF169 family)
MNGIAHRKDMPMEQWHRIGEKVRRFVNPATFPVAVRFVNDPSEIPPSARRPLQDLKVRMAPCQGAAMTRRYGWTVAFGREDAGCAIAAHTYGWERVTDEEGVIRFMTHMNYARDAEAVRNAMASFRQLELGEDLVVVYSPLERTRVEPDVVLIHVNPAQLMRLIHGGTYQTGRSIESSFSGRAASCTEGVIGAHLDQALKVVVPGNGDRVWGGCQDHEMVMALPSATMAGVVEGLEKTHAQGIRYPIPTYMRYSPEVALSLPLSDVFATVDLDGIGGKK